MTFDTQSIRFDRDGRPIPQYFNPRTNAYEPAHGDAGALSTSSVQRQFVDSVIALAAGATFTGVIRDLTAFPRCSRVVARAFAGSAGTLFIEQSHDGTIWRSPTGHSRTVAAGAAEQLTVDIVTRFWRVRYVNGATAQGTFELLSAEFGI